jgi:eukaryotic-like serine/threonine-protein kinase
MYKVVDVIGSGGFGVVIAAIDKAHNKKVALKIAFKKDRRGETLINEYEILKGMDHPNVMKLYSMINYSNFLIISMKLAEESLDEFSNRRFDEGNPLSELELS